MLNFDYGESRLIKNEWAHEIERASTTVASSTWVYDGTCTLAGPSLTGSRAEVMFTPTSNGWLTNTATFANGEVRLEKFYVEVSE